MILTFSRRRWAPTSSWFVACDFFLSIHMNVYASLSRYEISAFHCVWTFCRLQAGFREIRTLIIYIFRRVPGFQASHVVHSVSNVEELICWRVLLLKLWVARSRFFVLVLWGLEGMNGVLSHHRLFSNAPIATGHLRWSISTKLIRMDRCPVKHGWIFRFRSLHPRLISLDSRPRWTWNKNWPAAWWAHVTSIRGWRSSQTLLTFQSALIVLGDGTKQKRIFNSSCNVIANRCNEVL